MSFNVPALPRPEALSALAGNFGSDALYVLRDTPAIVEALKAGHFVSKPEIWALLKDTSCWKEPVLAAELSRLLWKAAADKRLRTLLGWKVAMGQAPKELVQQAPKEGLLGELLQNDPLDFAGRCLLLDRTPGEWFKKAGLPFKIPFVQQADLDAVYAFVNIGRSDRQSWLIRCITELQPENQQVAVEGLLNRLSGEGVLELHELRAAVLAFEGIQLSPRAERRRFEWAGVERFSKLQQLWQEKAVPGRLLFWSNYAARLRSLMLLIQKEDGWHPLMQEAQEEPPGLVLLDFTHLIVVEDFQSRRIGLVTELKIEQLRPPISEDTLEKLVFEWVILTPDWAALLYQQLKSQGIEPSEGLKRFRGCLTDARTGMPTLFRS
jgi:hypothetical protein